MSARWTFHIDATRLDGETASGDPIHITPSPVHGLYSTSDPSEAKFLNGNPKAVLVDYNGPAAPAPSLLAKGKQ